MPDPTFLIIGAQKCGTTWLCDMIRQHPEAFCPARKELHFFNKRYNYAKGLDWYRAQFDGHCGERAVGEATPNYLWTTGDAREIEQNHRTENVPALVRRHYPEIKLLVTLRDPVARAVSAYHHQIRARKVAPHQRILDVMHDYGILTMGYYQIHLERWLEVFAREQFLLLIFEDDLEQRPRETLRRVFRFLGIDEAFVPQDAEARPNANLGPLYRTVNYYVPWIKPLVKRFFPRLRRVPLPFTRGSSNQGPTAQERAELARRYAAANAGLEDLLGRRLPWSCLREPAEKTSHGGL